MRKKTMLAAAFVPIVCIGAYWIYGYCFPYPATGLHDMKPFRKAERVEVFSLEYWSRQPGAFYDRAGDGWFHGFRTVGSIEVPLGVNRVSILDAFQHGLNKAPRSPAAC